jgi:hypothetical protein
MLEAERGIISITVLVHISNSIRIVEITMNLLGMNMITT